MSHTQGKLEVRTYDESIGSIDSEIGDMVAKVGPIVGDNRTQETRKANTRRLVACWNALDGVPTEWLENYVAADAKNLMQENAALKQERDELLVALERLERVSGQAIMRDYPDRAEARALIAKYKENE